MRIDPDREHHNLLDDNPIVVAAAGKPEESRMPDPVASHTAAEHRRAVSSLKSQPEQQAAGHSRDHPPAPETVRAQPIALARPSSFRAICALTADWYRGSFVTDSEYVFEGGYPTP